MRGSVGGQRCANTLSLDHLTDQAMPKFNPLPLQEELHRLFSYSLITGNLYWTANGKDKSFTGKLVGTSLSGKGGYKRVSINGISFRQHRIIWCWVTGFDPGSLEIDHIDGQTCNNAWHNLRLANHSQNCKNRKDIKGWVVANGKYRAYITVEGKTHILGNYRTAQEARAAYVKAATRIHGEFARL
jgi:hypothetical protein